MSDPRQPDATAPHVPADAAPADTVGPRDDAGSASGGDTAGPRDQTPTAAPAGAEPNERYRFGEELARGGMGVVYRAHDRAFDREVAVKVLGAELSGSDAARRFVYEARITGQLQHPSVPPVHDLGTLPDGRPFLAMKYIRGRTLADEIKARPFTPEEFDHYAGIFEQICLAVAFAHSRGIIHRDLKPANVMVGNFGEVQVMDWGLAKHLGAPDEAPGVEAVDGPEDRTRAGAVMGTPAYMPPEQARGELDRIDERADVFALGGILCAVLTGRPPYTGSSGREVWQKAAAAELDDALERLGAVKDAGQLPAIARRCLAADSDRRFAHAGEVRAAVDAARNKAREVQKQYDLDVATADADRLQRRADRRAGNAVRVGLGGLALGAVVAAVALLDADDVKTRARDGAVRFRELDEQRQKDLFPTLVAAAHRHSDENVFDPKADGPGRGRAIRGLEDTAARLDPADAAHAHLLVSGVHDLAQDGDFAEEAWRRAVERYKGVAPDHTEVALAVRACEWFGTRPTRSKLDAKVTARLVKALEGAAPSTTLPNALRTQARAALDRLRGRKPDPPR